MHYAWPAVITPDDPGFAIEIPDVPGARSWSATRDGVLERGREALVSMLSAMIDDGEAIPKPSPARGRLTISLPIVDAAKIALHAAMQEQEVSNVELASALGLTEKAVRRLRDPRHNSKIESIDAALHQLGLQLELLVTRPAPHGGQMLLSSNLRPPAASGSRSGAT